MVINNGIGMKIQIASYVPTLNEYVNQNYKKNTDPKIKEIVDDFCDFPESTDHEDESANLLCSKRDILLKSAQQRIDDIIMLNRYALFVYNSNVERIIPLFENGHHQYDEFCNMLIEQSENDEQMQMENARQFRNFNTVCEIFNARKIADEGMIIHLWATIEQHVKKAFLIMGGDEKMLSYKWHKLKNRFKELGIDLESILSYDVIDEIRVVNNKIKHLYVVDEELCKYKGFAEHKGQKMSNVNYRTHEYALAAHHFMNRLVMAMGPITSYGHGCE